VGAFFDGQCPHVIDGHQVGIVVNADVGGLVLLLQVGYLNPPIVLNPFLETLQAGLAAVALGQQ
jgi:hypothetical protein